MSESSAQVDAAAAPRKPPAAPIPTREIVVLTRGGADGAERVLSMLIQRAYRVRHFAFEVAADSTLTEVRCGLTLSWDEEDLLLARLERLTLVVRATRDVAGGR